MGLKDFLKKNGEDLKAYRDQFETRVLPLFEKIYIVFLSIIGKFNKAFVAIN